MFTVVMEPSEEVQVAHTLDCGTPKWNEIIVIIRIRNKNMP